MAIKKTIEIDVNTNDAVKDVNKLTDSVKYLEKQTEEVGAKSFKGVGDNAKKAGKGVKGLGANFKALGGAIKATGIGLLVAVLASLVEGLQQNERASKFFKTAFEAVSIVTQDFINFVLDNAGGVVDFFKAIFEDPLQSIKDLGQALQDNLVERFNSFLDLLGFVGDAFKKFTEGNFSGALESVKSAGKELLDVGTGVNNVFDKVVDGVSGAVDSITEYGSAVLDTAEKNIDLARSAEIASAKQALLVEQFDRQAEKLRQIRDNDLISIDERIKANNDLAQVLEKQEKAQLAEADAILASAQAQVNKNNNTENQVALLEAQANKAGVVAQIEGFRSEQLANETALIKEKNDLVNAGIEADTQRALNQQKFNTSLEEDALKRLEQQRLDLEAEKEIEAERLQLKIDSFALGTQARLDAENELKDRLQEINQEIILNGKEVTKQEKVNAEAQQKLDNATAENKKKAIDATKNILADASKLLGESTAVGKASAVASATIETYQSAVSSYNSLAGIPIVGPGLGIAAAGVAVASGIANVKNILSVKTPGGGGGGSVPGGSTPPPPPAFNLVGSGGGVEQIQDDLGGEQPVKAFVVGSEVTNQQEIDNAQAESASLG